MSNIDLTGKVGLVTGGGTGIGRAVALALGRAGASVVVSGRRADPLEETVALLTASGIDATSVAGDVAQEADVEAMVGRALEAFGRLDIACNNAGIEGVMAPIHDLSAEAFDATIAVNLRGCFLSMKHEVPAMLAGGGGAIVNVSSVNAVMASAEAAAYSASKAGVESLTATAALELATRGVRVNALRAGAFITPMHERLLEAMGEDRQASIEDYEGLSPMARRGEPAEAAEAALWLCSDAASYVTGTCLSVDGGIQAGFID